MHVPELLYSWRIHAGSTASIETGTKPQTITSQRHLLDQHLRLTGLDHAFDIVQNERFPHNGIWRLKPHEGAPVCTAILLIASADANAVSSLLFDMSLAIQPGALVLIVDGAGSEGVALKDPPQELKKILGRRNFNRIRKKLSLTDALALCAKDGHPTVAIIDAGVTKVSDGWIREGSGMFSAESDVGAVSGEVLLPDGRVAWRGGFRGFGAMAGSPDYGRAQADSGYHGMGWCQRTCDSVPSVCFLARTDLLQEAAARLVQYPLAVREFAGQLVTAVWSAGLRIVYTPFIQIKLAHDVAVEPTPPRDAADAARQTRSYYHSALSRELKTAYGLSGDIGIF